MQTANMMDVQLTVGSLIDHAAEYHGDTEVVSVGTDGGIERSDWASIHRNAKRLHSVLKAMGLKTGQRIATLAWNNIRHLELYFGVASGGMVCHTINPRLFAEQLTYILNHAQDQILFFDKTFLPVVQELVSALKSTNHFVLLGQRDDNAASAIEGLLFYDELIQEGSEVIAWPEFDERSPASLCYTSGTTGNPKGVSYTHRSILLHSFAAGLPDSFNLSARDAILPAVPMFHVSAWGSPYVAAMVGAKLVLPGPNMDGKSLVDLIDAENVTISIGVPTIWIGLLAELDKRGACPPSMTRTVVGGSAMPSSMFREFRDKYGVDMIHGWGMTETSPVATLNQFKAKHLPMPDGVQADVRLAQGRPVFGVKMRVLGEDGQELSKDGATQGNLQIKGHWIVDTYFGKSESALTEDGWFDTGDIATIDPDGYMVICDRAKDIIKSGGEWISTVELENIAISHPAIRNAAAIAARHPKWDERPVIVVEQNSPVTDEEILGWYEGKIAKWQVPDAVVFVDALPLGATGKVLKNKLREQFQDCLVSE